MAQIASNSTTPASILAASDASAAPYSDAVLLIGRILVASVFILTAWGGNPTAAFLKSLNYPAPEVLSIVAIVVEWIVGLTIIFGAVTRYGALLGVIYVVIAVATAHLYWQYPAQQQNLRYVFFTKDVAILGALLVLVAVGPGRYSFDRQIGTSK